MVLHTILALIRCPLPTESPSARAAAWTTSWGPASHQIHYFYYSAVLIKR